MFFLIKVYTLKKLNLNHFQSISNYLNEIKINISFHKKFKCSEFLKILASEARQRLKNHTQKVVENPLKRT